MSSGRSADGREVQIPLQQVAPSLISPLSCTPAITPPSHRSANPWPLCEPAAQQGTNSSETSPGVASPRPAGRVTGLLCVQVSLRGSCLFTEDSEITLSRRQRPSTAVRTAGWSCAILARRSVDTASVRAASTTSSGEARTGSCSRLTLLSLCDGVPSRYLRIEPVISHQNVGASVCPLHVGQVGDVGWVMMNLRCRLPWLP